MASFYWRSLYYSSLFITSSFAYSLELFFNILEKNGYHALPIVGFLSFLIGVVITYQIGLELRTYGANIFIINLLGLAIFREFGPLMTAIIVTGRTGSAFTAQLG